MTCAMAMVIGLVATCGTTPWSNVALAAGRKTKGSASASASDSASAASSRGRRDKGKRPPPPPKRRKPNPTPEDETAEEEEEVVATPAPHHAPPTPPSDVLSRASFEISAYGDTDHIFVFSPTVAGTIESPTDGWSVTGRYLVDVVSAASVDIVSTASQNWHEIRQAGSFAAAYKPHDFGINLAGSVSHEGDYLSLGAGGSIQQDFDQKNFTLVLGYGFSDDTAGRTGTPFSAFSHKILRNNFDGGLTFVIDRATIAAVSADAIIEKGDQSKPYRYIPMFSAEVAPTLHAGESIDNVNSARLPERPLEQLPLERERYALTGRIAHRFDGSTVRMEERLYHDTWGQSASTTDFRYLIDVTRRFTFWPHFRFNIQNAVSFWQLAYTSNRGPLSSSNGQWTLPAFRTGDRELGALWAATTGLGIRYGIGADPRPTSWMVSVSGDIGYTSFADTLYILYRTSALISIGLEGEL